MRNFFGGKDNEKKVQTVDGGIKFSVGSNNILREENEEMARLTAEEKAARKAEREAKKAAEAQAKEAEVIQDAAPNVEGEPVPAEQKEPVAEKPAKKVEGSELSDEEVFAVVTADNKEEAIRVQLDNVVLDMEVPHDSQVKLIRMRDNARQAFKENEVRFKNTQLDLHDLEQRMQKESTPDLVEYRLQLDTALAKYVSKMRKYLKRYDAAKDVLDKIKAEEDAQKAKEAEAAKQTEEASPAK
jgi:hypothetical protein